MSQDDSPDQSGEDVEVTTGSLDDSEEDVRSRLEVGADKAVEEFDSRVIDLLSWILDTETRARIYVYLRQQQASTSDEIAEGTGLYPSTVREAVAELHEEGIVTRQKRESDGAGNNPYEYSAIPPSDLVSEFVGDIQDQLNAVFNLDEQLNGSIQDHQDSPDSEPVTISVEDAADEDDTDDRP
jgi:predicted transcriptional regulator